MRFSPFDGLALIVPFTFLLFWLAVVVVHILFGAAVFRHAASARDAGSELVFAPPPVWALATLVTGVIGATCYWLLHCSSIRPTQAVPVPTALSHTPEASVPHA